MQKRRANNLDARAGAFVRQFARLLKSRLDNNHANQSAENTKISDWTGKEKGIDDALAKNEKISALTVFDWSSALDETCRDKVRKVWDAQLISGEPKSVNDLK